MGTIRRGGLLGALLLGLPFALSVCDATDAVSLYD